MGGLGSGPKKEVDIVALERAFWQELNLRAAAKRIGGISRQLAYQRLKPIVDFKQAKKERQKRRREKRKKEKERLMKQLAFLFKSHQAELKTIEQFRELARKELGFQVARQLAAQVMKECDWQPFLPFEDFIILVREHGSKGTAEKLGIQVSAIYQRLWKHGMKISQLRG